MKSYLLLPVIALVLLGAGCSSPAPVPTPAPTNTGASGSVQERTAEPTSGKSTKQTEAETALGIALPANTEVLALIQNKKAIGVVGSVPLSLSETTTFFSTELGTTGYQVSRNWGASPYDDATNQTASFTGNGETWAFVLSQEGNMTTFDLQRQL